MERELQVIYIPTSKEAWEKRLIAASLSIEKEQARCLSCGYLYWPRYPGEQVCSSCRSGNWRKPCKQ